MANLFSYVLLFAVGVAMLILGYALYLFGVIATFFVSMFTVKIVMSIFGINSFLVGAVSVEQFLACVLTVISIAKVDTVKISNSIKSGATSLVNASKKSLK